MPARTLSIGVSLALLGCLAECNCAAWREAELPAPSSVVLAPPAASPLELRRIER